ncbi:MAG: polysaccharide pyruvyl transferase family protein [Candidatus Thermoplasmatota archaeon]
MTGLRFLLVGAELSRNRGTASIVLSAIMEIRRVFENPAITFISYSPERDRRFETALAIRIPHDVSNIRIFAETILIVLERCLRIELVGGETRKSEYKRSDVVVNLSGDGLTDDFGVVRSVRSWLPFFWCIILRVPVVIHSQSIGPFRNGIARRIARFFLDRVDLLIVREEISRNYLIQIGVKQEVLMTADGAFLLGAISENEARETLKMERIPVDNGRPLVGIAPSELLFRFSRSREGVAAGEYLLNLAELADHMIEEHDVDVVFIPHVTDPNLNPNDRDIAVAAAKKSKYRERVFVIEGAYQPEVIRGIIGLCTLFIGARMHANIAALTMHVPTVAISYSNKTPGIMSMAGQDQYVRNWDDPPERLLETVEDAWERRTQIRRTLLDRIPEIQALARRTAELISERVVQKNM